MKSVIRAENINRHIIKKYHFGVLGSGGSLGEEIKYENINGSELQTVGKHLEQLQKDGEIEKSISVSDEIAKEEEEEQAANSLAIEEILKKNDEITTQIVKLQMQIEKQKEEYEARLEEERQRVYEEGKNDGINEIKQQYEAKQKEMEERMNKSLQSLDETISFFKDTIQRYEKELSETAVEIAKEVIQKEIENNSKEVAKSLSEALMKEISSATDIKVMVNPEDYEYIKQEFDKYKHIEVTPNDAVAKGGVIILSDHGNLDGNITTRLKSVAKLINS